MCLMIPGSETWTKCNKATGTFKNPNFKRFETRKEAEDWIKEDDQPTPEEAPEKVEGYNNKFYTTVYTDGSCLGNGKTDAKGGIGIYFGPEDKRNVSEPYVSDKITNQRAEVYAAYICLKYCAEDNENVNIMTDSSYLINSATTWRHGWAKRNWVNSKGDPVDNQDILRPLFDLIDSRSGKTIFTKVKAHNNVHGNEMADMLAVKGANRC